MVLAESTDCEYTDTMSKDRIRAIRKSLKMSQERFALLIGTGTTTVWRWEAGENEPIGGYRILLELVESGHYPVKR